MPDRPARWPASWYRKSADEAEAGCESGSWVSLRVPRGADTHFDFVLLITIDLDDGGEHTPEEVGRNFAVTRERIRQIEAKALRKLRHPSRSHRLRAFLDSGG